jgi:hypothetical protein
MATPPITPPPGAGIPIEAAFGAPPPPPPVEVNVIKTADVLVGPEKTPEKIPMGALGEDPTLILGIIQEHAEEQPRKILEAVSSADVSTKPEQSETPVEPESAEATPDATPVAEKPKATPAEEAEAALEAKKREEIKQELRELGKILLDVQDTRASMVALGLAAGDTPIGSEFREQILTMILQEKKPEAVPEDVWRDKQARYTAIKAQESKMKKFFDEQGFPMENSDTPGDEAAAAYNGLFQKDKLGRLTNKAKKLRAAFGWTDEHPMPTKPEKLAPYIGGDEQNVKNMKKVFTKTNVESIKQRFKDTFKQMKEKAPGYLMVSLLAIGMLGQMLQEGDAPRASH